MVDFEEDAKLFQSWPPPHFDQQVSAMSEALLGVAGAPTWAYAASKKQIGWLASAVEMAKATGRQELGCGM